MTSSNNFAALQEDVSKLRENSRSDHRYSFDLSVANTERPVKVGGWIVLILYLKETYTKSIKVAGTIKPQNLELHVRSGTGNIVTCRPFPTATFSDEWTY